jgi:hypothetical protein
MISEYHWLTVAPDVVHWDASCEYYDHKVRIFCFKTFGAVTLMQQN